MSHQTVRQCLGSLAPGHSLRLVASTSIVLHVIVALCVASSGCCTVAGGVIGLVSTPEPKPTRIAVADPKQPGQTTWAEKPNAPDYEAGFVRGAKIGLWIDIPLFLVGLVMVSSDSRFGRGTH